MTSACDFHPSDFTSKIIWLNIFPEFFSYSHMIFKLSLLSNYTEYPKRVAPLFVLSPLIILKSLY